MGAFVSLTMHAASTRRKHVTPRVKSCGWTPIWYTKRGCRARTWQS